MTVGEYRRLVICRIKYELLHEYDIDVPIALLMAGTVQDDESDEIDFSDDVEDEGECIAELAKWETVFGGVT